MQFDRLRTMRDYPCRRGAECWGRGSGCQFSHPGDPDYGRAVQNKEGHDTRRGGSKRVTSSNSTSLPEGPRKWGKPPSNSGNSAGVQKTPSTDKNPSSAWNFSGHSTTSQHTSNPSKPAETTSGFGNSGWGSTTSNNASTSNATGWATGGTNSTWGADDTALGWGAGSADGGWGTNNSGSNHDAWGASATSRDNGGWGTNNSGGNTDGGGWGSTTAGEANSESANPQDQPSIGSWGSLESGREKSRDKDTGKEKKTDDIHMRDPSPPRKQDEPKAKSVQRVPQSPTKPPSESPAQTPLSPKYTSESSVKISSDLKTLALEVAKPKAVPVKIKGVEGRKALYRSIIKHTKNAIIAFIAHGEAQTDLNRWKDTQNSSIYSHATQKTRKILDSERATFHRRLQDVEDAFQKEINALVNLPEPLATDNKKKKPNVLTKEVIAQYTQELQDWFKDLELHKRLLVEKEKTEEGEIAAQILEEAEEGEVMETEEGVTEKRLTELLRSGQWTWKEFTDIVEGLEGRFEATQTGVYFDIFTCIDDDSRAKLRLAGATLESTVQEEPQDDDLSLPAVSKKIATAGKALEQQSGALARLLGEIAALEKKVEAVRQQRKEADSVCQMAVGLFGEFEQWKEEDNAQLTAITEQVRLLHLYDPSAPSKSGGPSVATAAVAPPHRSAGSPSVQEPISTFDLIDPIRRLVVDAIHKELKLCFDILRFRCIENQQKFETEIEEEAKRIVSKAEIVKKRITPSRESSLRPVISPTQSNILLAAHARAPT